MKCPFCGHDTTKVLDSRTTDGGIRRRRKCEGCEDRFTTYEQVQRAVVMVVKKDGRREEFNREKLLSGLRISARKRPLPSGAVEAIVEDIEQRLMGSNRSEVPSRVIGEMAITRLKGLDPIAYIRFASVYHQFVSLDEMLEELNRIANSGPFSLAPEQAKLFEDDLDALIRGEMPTSAETADALQDLEREPVSIEAHRTATTR
jgi:transcriptional repressor NrdR